MDIDKAISDLQALRDKHGSGLKVKITLADYYEGDTYTAIGFRVRERYDHDPASDVPFTVVPCEYEP